MERTHAAPLAEATGLPISHCRTMLRILREAELVPGARTRPAASHIARIILALSSPTAERAVEAVRQLQGLRLASAADLPAMAEDCIAQLVATVPRSPVLADFDVDGGVLHIGDGELVLECLTLAGKRACIRYGSATPNQIQRRVSISMDVVLKLAKLISKDAS